MSTTHQTVGHESTVDKIKDALHLNKNHTTAANHTTAGTHVGSTHSGVGNTHSGVGTTHSGVGNTHSGVGTTHSGVGTTGGISNSTNAGPHNSNLANKVDPTVDSDLSGRGTTHSGVGNTHSGVGRTGNTTGVTGGISNSTNAGPHNSNLANKVDPTVDSDLSGRGNHHHGAATGGLMSGSHATPGSGTAQNTAGPHNSDTLNKLDPRVDADLDGSKTFGGNRTNAGTRDVHDAAQVPPSVFAAHHGEPQILHDDHTHNYAGRHGSAVATQDQLSGV